ncbi:hypothetical protein GCM10010307_10290 [Streptomyces vastus]|uniref:ATP-grasp-modified RiPP n=1 Tax=Streptomyces vastus TaxID=285451 RepID=A0ABP6CS02_9ACTN
MAAHPGHVDMGRSFRLTVQPGEDPVQTSQLSFGTHVFDVTASELCATPERALCDDDVMWDSSQEGVYRR